MGALNYTLGEVFERFTDDYNQQYPMTVYQQKVVTDIQHCRTGAMGGHWSVCNNCGELKKHYDSCGNRHCPTCQGINKERWILERTYDLLPVKYFHVVFTVPSELRGLFLQNRKLLYNLLFSCAWETIDEFAQDPRQQMMAKTGMTAILHIPILGTGYGHKNCCTTRMSIVLFRQAVSTSRGNGKQVKEKVIFSFLFRLWPISSGESLWITFTAIINRVS